MKRTGPSSVSTTVSIESRVVPGRSWTTERSSPMRRLNSVDLPTLGRPTRATEKTLSPPNRSSRRRRRARRRRRSSPVPSSSAVPGVRWLGSTAHRSSSRSPVPRPCRALTGWGSPRPRPTNSHTSGSRLVSSTLLTASEHGHVDAAQQVGHPGVLLGDAHHGVDHHDHDLGLTDGPLALLADLGVELAAAGQPTAGVDQHEGLALPLGLDLLAVAGDARALLDDGLAPADDAVHQRRLAHVGAAHDGDHGQVAGRRARSRAHRAPTSQGPAQGHAVGGHHLDRAGQVVGRSAVEEPALGQAHVGQQVAVADGFVAQHPVEVVAHHQAGHADVAAEELVVDR